MRRRQRVTPVAVARRGKRFLVSPWAIDRGELGVIPLPKRKPVMTFRHRKVGPWLFTRLYLDGRRTPWPLRRDIKRRPVQRYRH